jgi:eukaryotic-like serine/threonine-protein kinase
VWAADGERAFYITADGGVQAINVNSGKKDAVFPAGEGIVGGFLQSASPHGHYLVWTKSTGGQSDLWMGSLDGGHAAARFMETPYNEFRAVVSPDGHWIAYVTHESGADEVMVESFPQPGRRKRISPEGGAFPERQQDGKMLYYLAPSAGQRKKLMAARVDTGSTLSASRPEFLFETQPLISNPRRGQYVPFDNDKRFLFNAIVQESKPRAITIVLNWPSLLK